jgi:hypothetical protein
MKRLTREELRVGWLVVGVFNEQDKQELFADRPRTRADCRWGNNQQRPCPWVSCKHHLYLDVNPETGSITLNFPDLEPWEMQHTCALDVTERGALTLEEVGEVMNLTRERIRQIEVRALVRKARAVATQLGLDEVEIGQMRRTALADAEDIEFGVAPSDVSFQIG